VYIDGVFVKVTGIGVYLEENAVTSLASKWKGRTAADLLESLDFYRDIIKGRSSHLVNPLNFLQE